MKTSNIYTHFYGKLVISGILLVVIVLTGTVGYRLLGGEQYTLFDGFYMTLITISTIGYGEIVDFSGNPSGRIFTIFIALSGIGVLFYMLSNLTAFFVEGEMTEFFRRRKMEKMIGKLKDHYIVCSIGMVGRHIVNELNSTKRPLVIIESEKENIEKLPDEFKGQFIIEGAATDDDILLKAGIENAKGLFAVTADDHHNLVISLTARHLNSNMKIVACCNELKNMGKIKKAGADSVVSPNFIGGLRMASEMIRPQVVTFLDTMLRDRDKNLRIEELPLPDEHAGKMLSTLDVKKSHHILLLAIKTKADWVYAPADDYIVEKGDTLIFMTTPDEKNELDKFLL
jgi:voltage-gated potassium channel